MLPLALLLLHGCGDQAGTSDAATAAMVHAEVIPPVAPSTPSHIDPAGSTIGTRFRTPAGFVRSEEGAGTFAAYLRGLPLKEDGAPVRLYHGEEKIGLVHDAVVDLPIGSKDLHQCADAIMRLRAEYLHAQHRHDEIHFNLTNGFRVDYSRWMAGDRVAVSGNKTSWHRSAAPGNTPEIFWKYLEFVFTYAGTLSLSKELKPVPVEELRIGDIFIQGGSPGHAVIVVDLAMEPGTGEKIFLLAQSYMPAQEIHIIKNPNDSTLSPWYPVDFGERIETQEWTFGRGDLKRFE
jgi:hypothetical protein